MSPLTSVAIVVALLAVSSSAPLIAFAAAPALAIAFWRNALAIGVIVPATLAGRRAELARLDRRTLRWSALAGVALAVHFGTWVPSAKLTSAAAATALMASQPVWQGLISIGQGRRLPRVTWIGIGVAVLGAVLATGADVTVSARAVAGDLLALFSGAALAAYTALGERARTAISTTTYTAICYTVCAVLLGAVCLASGTRLTGYDGPTWLAIVALAGGAQLLGHSLLNYALREVSATTLSVLILLEVPGAALIAWVWLGQAPQVLALPGLALLVAGVLVVVLGANRRAVRQPVVPTA